MTLSGSVAWILGGIAALLLLAALRVRSPGPEAFLGRRLYCPWARRHVTARFLLGDDGQPIAVLSCTGWTRGPATACGRVCLGGPPSPGGEPAQRT